MKRKTAQFTGLALLSLVLTGGLLSVHLSAALLVGPMIAAILCAVSGYTVPLHHRLPVIAQTVLGQLMAHSLTLAVLHEIVSQWDLFIGGVFSVILMSFALGWMLARFQVLPGSSALWGSSPGAASAMVLLCESYGADQRLVAFMLYLRVILVTLATSIVAHIMVSAHIPDQGLAIHHVSPAPASHGSEPLWPALLIMAMASLAAPFLRLPAAPLLLSMGGGIVMQAGFGMHYALPFWMLAPSYVVLGWMIGRRFTTAVLRHVWRALPAIMLSTCILIGGCALLSWPLARIAHVDLLSAYLATSPGGADSIAIIAASNPIDVPFVMAMQVARFMVLLALAPFIATRLARILSRKSALASNRPNEE